MHCSKSKTCASSSAPGAARRWCSTASTSTSTPGETLCVVGESGCGKSMTALALLRLIPSPPGRIKSGAVLFQGEDLAQASEARMREVRGDRISMIFQEPMTSLNPVFTVGDQIGESLRLHAGLDAKAGARALDRDAATGRHSGARAARRRVPAPAVGRHAPARDDRDGARLPARHPDRRRADHRARRHGAGADLRPAARPAAREGHRHPDDHARHGRGGRDGRPRDGDVRRPRDRAGHHRRRCCVAAAIRTRRG